jgi:hypothetical protein
MKTVPDLDTKITEMIVHEQGGKHLHDRLHHQTATTLKGRLRAGVGYTGGKKTPFHSLAADGGKLALWNLLYAGFDVYGFIHDEILVQLPANNAEEQARKSSRSWCIRWRR